MNYDRTSSLCAELGPLHNAYPAAGPLSKALDDVGCDITDAKKMALGFPQPWPTPEGFSLPSPGSPASLRFQMKELAHRSCTPCNSQSQGNSGAFRDGGKIIREGRQDVFG
jgi:hypothetical protein